MACTIYNREIHRQSSSFSRAMQTVTIDFETLEVTQTKGIDWAVFPAWWKIFDPECGRKQTLNGLIDEKSEPFPGVDRPMGSSELVLILIKNRLNTESTGQVNYELDNQAIVRAYGRLNARYEALVIQFDPHSSFSLIATEQSIDQTAEPKPYKSGTIKFSFAPLFNRCKLTVEHDLKLIEPEKPKEEEKPKKKPRAYGYTSSSAGGNVVIWGSTYFSHP